MKKRIPKFKSLEQEQKFWATHSITEFLDELKPVKVKFTRPKKQLISLRLDIPQIQSLKTIASQRGWGYLSLIRYWIAERLNKERLTPTGHTH